MESINEQLEKQKELLKNTDNLIDIIKTIHEIIYIFEELSESQKATSLRVLLTQLELQNEALISRMKGIINE